MSNYEAFANVYDMMQYDVDYLRWYESLEKLFKQYVKKPNRVLELACGTGTLAILFSKKGYITEGVDLSEEMLSVANHKAKAEKQSIRFLHQNMTALNTRKKYDLIFSLCDGFNYLIEEEDLVQTFERVLDHLEEDGLFVFDLSSEYKLKTIIGNHSFSETFDDSAYIWENQYDEEEHLLEFWLTLFTKEKGLYNRSEEYHQQRAYEEAEIINLLSPYFKVLEVLDGDDFGKLKSTSQRICFVCKKI